MTTNDPLFPLQFIVRNTLFLLQTWIENNMTHHHDDSRISRTNADSQWNPFYNAFHRIFCSGNETNSQNIYQIHREKSNASARRLPAAALLERWPQVCGVEITFTVLPTNRFVSTTENSKKCVVKWIPLRVRVRSRIIQRHLIQETWSSASLNLSEVGNYRMAKNDRIP